ncbi:MAG: AMMECR1 domain-containing protein [Sulfurimonas sp.]|uniref:AMMECR1 domain-containing protein n=1 Tax=Sulfurimonas sp. TaxID=2022749 RepID=UPI0025F481C9|nr:AMMECR1 domain-containing protein [Sulfurimonas sp.]MCK9492254.1 AMMECR1 domain-containing protein [Sulfurimonas sp.]
MSRSVLLQLARESIQEVLESQRTIDKATLLNEHPLLNEKIQTTLNIYLDNELRGSCSSTSAQKSLLEEIIYNAKVAAFEDKNFSPLTTSEYLSCEIELILNTPDGVMSQKDEAILKEG